MSSPLDRMFNVSEVAVRDLINELRDLNYITIDWDRKGRSHMRQGGNYIVELPNESVAFYMQMKYPSAKRPTYSRYQTWLTVHQDENSRSVRIALNRWKRRRSTAIYYPALVLK